MPGKNKDLPLENLTMMEVSTEEIRAALTAVQARRESYHTVYGYEEGERRYRADTKREQDIDFEKDTNVALYEMGRISFTTSALIPDYVHEMFDQRRHELYGEQYDEIVSHPVMKDPRVAELLLQEALRTGEWFVLPDELVSVYGERSENRRSHA